MKKCEMEGCNALCQKYDHCSRHRPKKTWPSLNRNRTEEKRRARELHRKRMLGVGILSGWDT